MCGIVGSINYSGKYKSGMERALREMIWADTLRGTDATGLFIVDTKLRTDWVKECVDGWAFVSSNKRAGELLRDAENHPFIMAHNRAATMGDKDNAAHAHPITLSKTLALVHNGTLTTWPQRYAVENRIEHDSTAIAHIIAEGGPEKFVNSCYGAYALVWYDQREHTINFLRNEDRPLAIVYCDEGIIFYGSELGMVTWVAQRNGFKLQKHFYLQPHKLYTFEIGEPEPKVVDCKRKVWSSPVSDGDRFHYGYPSRYGSRRPRVLEEDREGDSTDLSDDLSGGYWSELARSEREARRLQEDTDRRTAAIEQEGKKKGALLGQGGKRDSGGKVVSINKGAATHNGKEHGKILESWKTFKIGQPVMFHVYDFGMIHPSASGEQYNIQAEPASVSDFPEIQIRGTVKESDFPQEKLENTDKYLTGDIAQIIGMESGNIIVWIKNMKETRILDPLKVKQKLNTDETAEAFVILPKSQKKTAVDQEPCQGCRKSFPKRELRALLETSLSPSGQKNTTMYRMCTDCCLEYGNDRQKILPKSVHNRKIDSVEIRAYQ